MCLTAAVVRLIRPENETLRKGVTPVGQAKPVVITARGLGTTGPLCSHLADGKLLLHSAKAI